MRHVAVIDVGKTNAKLALVELPSLREIAVRTRPNRVLAGPPYPHYDLDGHWQFFCEGLRAMQAEFGIDAVSVTTHGAAVTLIGQDGQALPMLDYEHGGPDAMAAEYDALRPDFAETGSARLPMGLNIGAQLHWQFAQDPSLRARIKHIVTYPQYWGYVLTGEVACDICSLGCHSDLWRPETAAFSTLVDRLGIKGLMAPPRRPSERLGVVSAAAAAATGLVAGTPVAVGIHDSNASLLPHILAEKGAFSVVSTGTWVIMMAMRGMSVRLDPARDTLINVNAEGEAVPSARFMGGREFDLINQGWQGTVPDADRAAVRARGVMLLPAVEPSSGPFQGRKMRWTEPPATAAERFVALSYYLALMTEVGLGMIGARGLCIVEGPFARNADYLTMLATLRSEGVAAKTSATGTSAGAALLIGDGAAAAELPRVVGDAALTEYARIWTGLTD
ncbi:MAG: FGGY-family carbohydrate kinase [Cypionkella sp.]